MATQTRAIIDFFAQVMPSMQVGTEDIDTPKQDRVLQMYYVVCDHVFNFQSLPEISRDDQFCRAKWMMRIFDLVSGLCTDVQATDFLFSDLMAPTHQRTRYFLSELINFYHFKCERQKELDSVDAELESLRRELEEERLFESKAGELVERAKAEQEEAHKKKIATMQHSTEVQKELAALKDKSTELRRAYDEKSSLDKQQQERIAQLEQAIADAEEKGRRLEMNIVSSPDRIVADNQEMRDEAAKLEEEQTRIDKEVRKLERVIENHGPAKRIVDNLHAETRHLELYKEKLASARRSRDESQQRLKAVESELRTVELGIREMEANNEAQLRKLRDQIQQDERQTELAHKEIQHLQGDQEDLKARRAKAREELRAGQHALGERKRATDQLYEDYDSTVEKLLARERLVQAEVERQRDAVEDALRIAAGTFRLSSQFGNDDWQE